MAKRTDIKKILIIGSGPIVIGQAAEFDYAGTQACLALKEEGYEVVLCNSNPATIMTDKMMADKIYIEPLVADVVKKIIEIEKPDSILPTLGGQTGLNLAMELAEEGYPAFVGPTLGNKSKIELRNKSFTTPKVLCEAGVPISIITDAPVIPLQYLPMCAGMAVDAGLNIEEAWRAITINPAVQTGIGDRVGSLEPGKDGDVVIWTADPLVTIGAEAYITVVDGNVVYSAE